MQISTIDVNTDSVERPADGKRDPKDAGGAESAFAAFFAQAQRGTPREPTATVASRDASGPAQQADAKKSGDASGVEGSTQKRTAKSDALGTVAEGGADGESANGSPAVKSQAKTSPRHATFSVSAFGGASETVKAPVPTATTPVDANVSSISIVSTQVDPQAAATPADTAVAGFATAKGVTPPATAVVDVKPASAVAAAANVSAKVSAIVENNAPQRVAAPLTPTGIAATVVAATAAVALPEALDEDAGPAQTGARDTARAAPVTKGPSVPGGTPSSPQQAETAATASGDGAESSAPRAASESQRGDAPVKMPDAKTSPPAIDSAHPGPKAGPQVNKEALPAAAASPAKADGATATGTGNGAAVTETPKADDTVSRTPPSSPKTETTVVRNVTQAASPDGIVAVIHPAEPRAAAANAAPPHHAAVGRTTVQALPEVMLRSVRLLISNGEQTMHFRLVPESLGEVRLEVTTANGEVSVKLASANAAVREILRTHAPGLQSAIAQDGSSVVRVTVAPDMTGGHAWLSSNAQHHGDPPNDGAQQRHSASSGFREPKQSVPRRARGGTAHSGNLNIYV